jgi:glucosylceramidase
MNMKRLCLLAVLLIVYTAASVLYSQNSAIWRSSTNEERWNEKQVKTLPAGNTVPDIVIDPSVREQSLDGFGICFNELGWKALSVLGSKEREAVIRKLFDPVDGLKLNICRMPVGSNDYSRNYYSLDDSVKDFSMRYFSLKRDREMLIPFIRAAMKYKPDLRIWGSPWCPPSWMKVNDHYACRTGESNGLPPEKQGSENNTQFRMQPEYLNAYALYFAKYILSYRSEGIYITGIHVQNEMNSCQSFPSCIWTARDLGIFIGEYLGPLLRKEIPDAEIWYGTYERPLVGKIDTIMQDPLVSRYISGVSFQWAGKEAIHAVHLKYPALKLIQSETECGDGSNDWKAAEYTFSLMKHYFENGISSYTFWNSVLDETGKSMWGWKQNSLITVNSVTGKTEYNPEYYLLKHFSYYVQPGARKVQSEGKNSGILAFINPDKSLILFICNSSDDILIENIRIGSKDLKAVLKPHSFNTYKLINYDGKGA